jgi:IS4 transposase
VFFVIRHKENIQFVTVKENELPENRHQHILKDEMIELRNGVSKQKYPKKLRRVAVWDDINKQTIEIITNQMTWTANTISELYKSRWQIEIFFREIKQLLHIKSFIGTSENAVMIQIWTALITILILKALKAMAKFNWHLSNLVAFIRLNLFVKIDLQLWLDHPFEEIDTPNQEKVVQGVLF